MPPQKQPPPKYPTPPLPPDPGDLPGCTQLEADIAAARAKLSTLRDALEEMAKLVRDDYIDCTEERRKNVGMGDCDKYLTAKAAFDAQLAEFNRLVDEYRKKAEEYNKKFPACNAPTCPNGQPPQGQLPAFQFSSIALPPVSGYIGQLVACKTSLETKLTDLRNKIKTKNDCLQTLANIRNGLQQKIPLNKVLKLNNDGTLELVDCPPPANATTAINVLAQVIKNDIVPKIFGCDTDDKFAQNNSIPYPTKPKGDNTKYLAEIKRWLQENAAPYVDKVVKAVFAEIEKLEALAKCLEALVGDGGKIQTALNTLSEDAIATLQNNINQQISQICSDCTVVEVTTASISYTLANQAGGASGATLNLNGPKGLEALVSIDRSANPPTGKINMGAAKDLITKEVGPQNECPPKPDNPGTWTLPITVTANIKQSIKNPDIFKAKISALSFKIGKKIDCTKDCPTLEDGDIVPINVNLPDVSASLTSCEGAK